MPRIMTIAVYCDDSFLSGGPAYAFGTYLGDLEMFDAILAPKWRQAIDSAPHAISEFKTSDCRQGTGEFANHLGWTKEERNSLTKTLVGVIADEIPNGHILGFGSVVVYPWQWTSANAQVMEHNGFGPCLLETLEWACNVFANNLQRDDKLQLVLDRKPGYSKLVAYYFEKAASMLPEWFQKRVEYPVFRDSKEVEALQAADLLAYETMKETKSRMLEPKRPVSKALSRLVDSVRHKARCITYDQLREIDLLKKEGRLRPGPDCRHLESMLLYESGSPWRDPSHWPFRPGSAGQ